MPVAPTGLPVEDCIPGVRAALVDPGAAVLQAPPGAGKTTVVPLRLLDEGWLLGRIVVLEPRRLATRAAARRMAHLLGEDVGGTVGYVTRDERRTSAATRIEVVTEGVLTRRLQRDPTLPGVALVAFDEFHERSLQGDLGLALALDVRRSVRPDLRLLVMSATLDGARVAAHLGGDAGPVPVVTSEGRAHPVAVRWAPPPGGPRGGGRGGGRAGGRTRTEDVVADVVARALREEPGDLLVFLPGVAEIRRTEERLASRVADPTATGGLPVDLLPLHGALPAAEQDAAVAPGVPGRRKVVLSTDIAETSLTVEGVRVVVDAGLSRVPRFDPRTGMTRLTTVPASRASADQRAGRAGRLEPGAAYRTWSKVEHAARRPFADPEITSVDLAALALELAGWGTPDVAALPFLEPPPARALEEGQALLRLLGALDGAGRPTDLGRALLDLPLHPRLGRLVVGAAAEGAGWLGCLVAAALEDRDVLRGRPDEVPADLALRVALLDDPGRRHPLADGRAVRRARDRAADLARRAGITPEPVVPEGAGAVLALAYPDRVGVARGGRGRFRLRTGAGAWVPTTDPLAGEAAVVAADLDGDRREARIRLGAALDPLDLELRFGHEVEEVVTVGWDADRDDVAQVARRRLGELDLGIDTRPAPVGPATTRALVDRVRAVGLDLLPWTPAARALQARLGFLRRHRGEPWPDVGDAALRRSLDDWLAPRLAGATGRRDLAALDLARLLRSTVPHQVAGDLDRLAPASLTLPSGRRVALDYADDPPALSVRVQELFGTTEHPTVAGVPVVLRLLSPADRPVQVTSDLAGFWAGSWHDVRKDLAGRYPKHSWPEDPATAAPPGPRRHGDLRRS